MKPSDAHLPPAGARPLAVRRRRAAHWQPVDDWLVEEQPVVLEYNGISHAVMLATPDDLEDFALGFSLTEGLIDSAADLHDCEAVTGPAGITLQLQIASRCFMRLKERRRTLAGRTGCGLCGTEDLHQVLRPLPALPEGLPPIEVDAVLRGVDAMRSAQRLHRATGAAHAAAWCDLNGRVRLLREDVGRHNALDKLIGAMATTRVAGPEGFIAVTSRASVEMVQKAAMARVPLLAAVSAPTALAVQTARHAGLTLVGLARGDDCVVYSHEERLHDDGQPVAGIADGADPTAHTNRSEP